MATASPLTVTEVSFCDQFASLSLTEVDGEPCCATPIQDESTASKTMQTIKATTLNGLNGQFGQALEVTGLSSRILNVITAYAIDDFFEHTRSTTETICGWPVSDAQILDLRDLSLTSENLQRLDMLCTSLLLVNLVGSILDEGLLFREHNEREDARPVPYHMKRRVRQKAFPKHPEVLICGTVGSPPGRVGFFRF